MTRRLGTRGSITLAAAAGLALHSISYLYFFVDDEAIPLVYARHLLEGRGLVYAPVEGRVEGYSDFLHVMWSAALLAGTRLMNVDGIHVLAIGTGVSLVLGVIALVITARILVHAEVPHSALAAGLGFLALAGPLAVWSCSSLETVPFACAFTALAAMVLPGAVPARRWLVLLVLTAVLLERVDGFVYVGALLFAALVCSPPERRRELLRTVAVPAIAIGLTYHAARYTYFGTLISAPLAAKVLYKVSNTGHAVLKSPPRLYLTGFLSLYGIVIVPAAIGAAIAARVSPLARAALLATALLAGYIQTVGDWMFGWRFVVTLLPLLAIVVAAGVAKAPARLQWVCAAAVIAASAGAAHTFAESYEAQEKRPIWWTHPRLGRSVWLAPYGDLIDLAQRTVTRGDVIAYNQAGLLPFVLDAQNIDDLGICSKFEAELPTTDVYFTEVGRYSPLTNAPVFSAAHAYLLYRDVRVLVSRTDLIEKANHGSIPEELLAGFFRLSAVDNARQNAVYVRTERDATEYRRNPGSFWQNLAHVSRLRRVEWDGVRVKDGRLGATLPFLRWESGPIDLPQDVRIDIRFADHDEDVHALYAGAVSARGAAALTFNLYDEAGRLVASEDAQADSSPAPLLRRYDQPLRARMLSIEARPAGSETRVMLTDVRVLGQSAALRDYVRRRLRFPAP